MSEREKLSTIIGIMDEVYVTDIYNIVIEKLAELMHEREEAEREKKIAEECERIYQRYKADPDSEEFVTFDEVMESLGITEEDLKDED